MKHDYDKIITRLTIILSKLYQGDKLQLKDLSPEFGVSLRTIQSLGYDNYELKKIVAKDFFTFLIKFIETK